MHKINWGNFYLEYWKWHEDKAQIKGASETAQQLRALIDLVEDLGSVLSIHIVAHNHL